jgi:hypothetical protein
MKLTICPALFLVAGVALAQAAPLEPNEASDTLTIQADSQLSGSCGGSTLPNPFVGIKFDRLVVKSGGTVETFTLPPEKVLVVTSFDWSVSGDPGGFANRSRTALLFRTTGGERITVPPLKAPRSLIRMGELEAQRYFRPGSYYRILEYFAWKWIHIPRAR